MYITTSKNADAKLRGIAKNLALTLHGSQYISRSDRTIERISDIASKNAINAVLVLMQKEDGVRVMKYAIGNEEWSWEPEALKISSLSANKFGIEEPIIFEAKTQEAKKIAQFLQLQNSIVAGLYADCEKIEVSAAKGILRIAHEKEEFLKFSYEWIEWQKK